jgi:molybdate transport system substrate-binding protein
MWLLPLALVPHGCAPASEYPDEITLFVAASLIDVTEELVAAFETAHPGAHLVLHTAASSMLARQIEQGAPADLFFFASEEWGQFLVDRGWAPGPVYRPISNRLVVVSRGEPPSLDPSDALSMNGSLALADPEHVPAGLYAREALMCLGLWERLNDRLRPALDVRAALHAVEQGAADAAIVYASDVHGRSELTARLLPDSCQPEIRYTLGRTRRPHAMADTLLAFMASSDRRPMWARHGFIACADPGRAPDVPC